MLGECVAIAGQPAPLLFELVRSPLCSLTSAVNHLETHTKVEIHLKYDELAQYYM